MRLRRPIAFILSAAVAASALTGCDSFSGHAAAAANSAQVQQLIEFIADLGLERDLRQALQKGGDLRQALLTLLGLESAVNFNVDDLTSARPGQHAVQVWEVTAQSAEDAAALAASQIRAVLEQLKSSGVTEGRIGMVEVDGKYYVVVDVEVTEENTFEPAKPVSDDDDDSEEENSGNQDETIIEGVTEDANDLLTIDVAELGLNKDDINAAAIIKKINTQAETEYDRDDIIELDLSGCAGLTSIGNSAFADCKSLETVTLPESLESIDNLAFAGCESLTSINLSDCTGLQSIGDYAFSHCDNLTSINLSNCTSLQRIDDSAFWHCTSLTSINLSGCTSLESIGHNAFMDCCSLEEVNLGGCTNLTSIGKSAFWGCSSLASIDLSGCASLTTIGDGAFEGCNSLTLIDLSNTQVNTIGNNAFLECTSLGTVLLPAKLSTIGGWAFGNCTDLQSIYFQSDPTEIHEKAFYGVDAEKLTVYYPSSWVSDSFLDTLKARLRGGGLSNLNDNRFQSFNPNELSTLASFFGL